VSLARDGRQPPRGFSASHGVIPHNERARQRINGGSNSLLVHPYRTHTWIRANCESRDASTCFRSVTLCIEMSASPERLTMRKISDPDIRNVIRDMRPIVKPVVLMGSLHHSGVMQLIKICLADTNMQCMYRATHQQGKRRTDLTPMDPCCLKQD
jgi:hypothetical protein